jgi:hypothetical protein
MTRSERFAASTQAVSPLPIPLPLQNEVVDERRLLTVPWVSLFQWVLNIGTRTFVTGTHAERVDPDDPKYDPANFRPGTWFWETDRTVLYQVRVVPVVPATVPPTSEPQWVYVLGTMEAPLASRPTDLGPYDAGFQFAATDTGQLYYWDGAVWVDITPYPYAIYGTHAERLAQDVDEMADGALWCETDRGNALYQIQGGVWWYIAGTMFGTLSPDERPTDLGVHDAGFDFRTSVPPPQEFMWSQTAWVEITPTSESNECNLASASGNLTLTTSVQDIPGTTIIVTKSGRYFLQGVFDFYCSGSGDAGTYFTGLLDVNGLSAPQFAYFSPQASTNRATVTQQWLADLTPGAILKLQATKSGGTGASLAIASNTTLSALWVNP